MQEDFYKRVYRTDNLWSSWQKVRENGVISKSPRTREEVREFANQERRGILQIQRELKQEKFSFGPQLGVLIERPGKAPRTVVKAPVANRIVQRAILNVVQNNKKAKRLWENPNSFGGIEGKGVPEAVGEAYKLAAGGLIWVLRSDIADFFTKVPKPAVFAKLAPLFPDERFLSLLQGAMTTELENMARLGKDAERFPLYEVGVAQGCALSPLFANILLADFDAEMNKTDVRCLRYIDDFLLLGPSQAAVKGAFKRALRSLAGYGLHAYDPFNGDVKKAEFGPLELGVEFLGCSISPGRIFPSRKSANRLFDSIDEICSSSSALFGKPGEIIKKRKTYLETMTHIRNVMRGWGNQYSFCNHPHFIASVDKKVSERVEKYEREYLSHIEKASPEDARRIKGLHILTDSKSDPIIKKQAALVEV